MGNRRQALEAGMVCVLFLVLAWYAESGEQILDEHNRIVRSQPGEGSTFVELTLDAEGVLEGYDYELEVAERPLSETEAKEKLAQAREEIDRGFYAEGEDADGVTQAVCMKDTYAGDLVSATWTLDNYEYMDAGGRLTGVLVPQAGVQIQASAELACGGLLESYCFSFMLLPADRPYGEELLFQVEDAIEQQQKQGEEYLILPEEVDGRRLRWAQAKKHLVPKVLFFEAAVLILLYFVKLEREKERDRLRREEMMLDYAEVVNKLLILLGSGMSLKQAWDRICVRYIDRKSRHQSAGRHIYEEMTVTNYEILDGESERVAYQRFGERTGLGPYHRLIRILLQNLQTGSRGMCQMLEQEAASALEERKALAKKLGEEAGTKMLLPLILMLGIVMAVIMVPAVLSFRM